MTLTEKIVISTLFACDVLGFAFCMFGQALAQEPAPPPVCQTASPCKIVILSAEEEQALLGPNMILDTAQQGRPLDLSGAVTYFRDKLRQAPRGTPQPAKQ